MDDKFEIKLQVGGTYYPLTIDRKDEVLYREAAKRINEKLSRYKEKFPQLSEEKYFVMTAIHISLINQMWEQRNDTSPYLSRIESMSAQIDEVLDKAVMPQD